MDISSIEIENLGKRYQIGVQQQPYLSLREDLVRKAKHIGHLCLGRKPDNRSYEDFWALRDVGLGVRQGECVGIIGRNGAGKSTLLKILSRITPPTEGRITMRGRVASLLEVGTGFHGELTGRENIYLNGVILGMTRSEVRQRFSDIVEFAEVGAFLDTPVKRYSSGMVVRLAFAVASHLDAEIIIVDEVLAVGDARFQSKCLGRMKNVTGEGRTVLFVSHNMAVVQSLCPRVAVLNAGRKLYDGPTEKGIEDYFEIARSDARAQQDACARKEVGIYDAWLQDEKGRRTTYAMTGACLDICLAYRVPKEGCDIRACVEFYGRLGEPITSCDSLALGNQFRKMPNSGVLVCRMPKLQLIPSVYSLTFTFHVNGTQVETFSDAISLEVESGDFYGSGLLPSPRYGFVLVNHEWRMES